MQDGLQKGNIDLDELVSTLMREKEQTASARSSSPLAEEILASLEQKKEVTPPSPAEEEAVPPPVEPITPEREEPQPPIEAQEQAEDEADEEVEETENDEQESSPPRPRRGLFGWLKREKDQDDAQDEEWADWGLKPIGHYHIDETIVANTVVEAKKEPTIEPIDPTETESTEISSGREQAEQPVVVIEQEIPQTGNEPIVEQATVIMPAVRVPAPVVEDVTRVVELPANDEPSGQPVVEQPREVADEEQPIHLPDQVSLEELVRVEDVEDADVSEEDEDAAVRLQRTRQEKIKDFVLSGEEEDNEPEEEAVEEQEAEEDEQEIEDFTGYETTKAVQLELQYRWRAGMIGLLLTVGLETVLLLLTSLTLKFGQSPITPIGYLTVHVFCLILMAVLNYPSVSRGLSGLFMLKANTDTAPAIALVVALCGSILHFLNLDAPLPMFAPLAGLLMLFNATAQNVKIARIRENFSFVSYPGTKYSAARIEDEKAALEIGRRVSAEGDVHVTYFRRANFLSSYLSNAYEEDGGDRYAKIGVPIVLASSLVLSLVLMLMGSVQGFWEWLSAFVFMTCLSAFAPSLAMQLPMKSTSRRMLRKGGFLVGWNAVDAFGQPDALTVDIADLYPDESMLLHGIKTFSGMHIDKAILDAASLSIRAGGPLSMIFRRIIENKEELLHEVDSLVYEQGMGLSGWVDGRRVLVGNRRLLQNHDVDVPSSDYEARYAKNGRRLVYLSTAGELSAMFVVSYLPDRSIGDALRQLCRSRVALLVRSNDSNITAEDLCRDFELDEYYVDVLPSVACRMYDQLVAEESESVPAMMASNGHILGTAMVLAACRSLHVKGIIALVLHIVTALIGLALCALWAHNGIGTYFQPACAFMVLASLLTWLGTCLKR